MKFRKVKAVQDDSGHWYVIPAELERDFYRDSEDQAYCDSGQFDIIYGCYRTGGDLNLVQLYVKVESKEGKV